MRNRMSSNQMAEWIHHDDYDNIFMMSLDSTGPASVLRLSLPLAE